MRTTTGPELRAQRELEEVTQAQLAAQIGVRSETISRWEQKAAIRPSIARRYREALVALASLREAV